MSEEVLVKTVPGRKFGIELEFLGIGRNDVESIVSKAFKEAGSNETIESYDYEEHTEAGYDHWHCTTDGSLPNYDDCTELVSRVMDSNSDEDWKVMRVALDALNAEGADVANSTGLHVHVDVSDLSETQIMRIVSAYREYEDNIDRIVGVNRRADTNSYCYSLRRIDSSAFQTRSVESFNNVGLDNEKYWKLNTIPYGDINTIEFRQHDGTLNYYRIKNWVRFCVEFVEHFKKEPKKITNFRSPEKVMERYLSSIISDPTISGKYKALFALYLHGCISGEDAYKLTTYDEDYWYTLNDIASITPAVESTRRYFEFVKRSTIEENENFMFLKDICKVDDEKAFRDFLSEQWEKVSGFRNIYQKHINSHNNVELFYHVRYDETSSFKEREDALNKMKDAFIEGMVNYYARKKKKTDEEMKKASKNFFGTQSADSFWKNFSDPVRKYYLRRTKINMELSA